MAGIDAQGCVKTGNGLFKLMHLFVCDAKVGQSIHTLGLGLQHSLKAGGGLRQAHLLPVDIAQVEVRHGVFGLQANGLQVVAASGIELSQLFVGIATVQPRQGVVGFDGNGLAKAFNTGLKLAQLAHGQAHLVVAGVGMGLQFNSGTKMMNSLRPVPAFAALQALGIQAVEIGRWVCGGHLGLA